MVDVWDALRSERPHRPAWPEDAIEARLREQTGRHFDPKVMDAFWKTLPGQLAPHELDEVLEESQ